MAEQDLPIVVIGAGPVGLAAAAHLRSRGLPTLVLEAGPDVGAAMSEWGHIRTFTPWKYVVDPTARAFLERDGWTHPAEEVPPTGAEIVAEYLRPLASALGREVVRTGARVAAVTRHGLDKTRTIGREERPFLVRLETGEDILARAVVDASGTWGRSNPLGGSGLPAFGEEEARDFLVGPLPDVLGRDRAQFAGRRTLVVGLGHSAANTLLNLAALAEQEPGTEIVWAIRAAAPDRLFGGGEADQLAARGKLGTDLRSLVASGRIELVRDFSVESMSVAADGATVAVTGTTAAGARTIDGLHAVAAATGFRPDLAMLSELRLDLDPGLEAPSKLAPLIDPQFHSCGTVPPHGHRDLQQPEPGFYIVGMKSYGRAPTFLITTGNEQVRSIAAALAGDLEAADAVELVLPETGVCSATLPLTDDESGGGCCGAPAGGAALEPACGDSDESSGCGVPEVVADEHHRLLPAGLVPQGFATGVVGGGLVGVAAAAGAGVEVGPGSEEVGADAEAGAAVASSRQRDLTPTGGCCS
ncbi:MAG TPA: NAD(P)-binding domain-containing protein [Nocardioidaceae bacterium]|nr:NAD(P)-binding domain-containing protein [Nocardioidaceae bacterium]